MTDIGIRDSAVGQAMASHTYCNLCGTKNNSSMVCCVVCGTDLPSATRSNPINSESFRAEKAIIFDIDETILDTSQRRKDAVRAGLATKEGKPKRSGFQTPKAALKKLEDFLYDRNNLTKDSVIRNSKAVIDHFIMKGYKIVYVTARHAKHREVTREQLTKKDFPIFRARNGNELIYFRPSAGTTHAAYKREVMSSLLAQYDIDAVFDDKEEVLYEAAKLGIPGLYSSIGDYHKYISRSDSVGARSNPVTPRDDPDPDYYICRGCGYKADPVEYQEIMNEGIDPTGTSPTCPFCGERNAYVPRYHWQDEGHTMAPLSFKNPEEYSEDYMVPRDIHRLGKAADSLESTYDEQDVPEWWKSKLSVAARDADTLADSLSYVADNPGQMLKMYAGEPTSRFRNMGTVFAEVQIGRNVVKDVGEIVQSVYRGLIGGRTSMAEKRMAMAIATMQKELSDRAEALGGNAVANLKIDYEMVQGSVTVSLIAHADAIKMARKPRSNPGHRSSLPFRPTSDCFITYKGKLVAKDMGHYIAFPGGGVDPGETPLDAATREVMEETGAILKGPMTSLGEITWVWNPEWADNEKRKQRYEQFQGERVYFFTGEVDRFVGATSDEGDAWEGEMLMDFSDAIAYLNKAKANLKHPNQEKYIEYQITCLEMLKEKNSGMGNYREAAGAIVKKGNKYLLLRRSPQETSFHGMFELPGGKLEAGETAEQAAVIETKEEAGLDVKVVGKVGQHVDHDMKKIYHGFIVKMKKGQRVKLSEEHDNHKWATMSEIMKMPKSKLSHHASYMFTQLQASPNPVGLFKKKIAPPKPVKPSRAIEKKILAWYDAYHEAINSHNYHDKSFTISRHIDFGKYMDGRDAQPMTLASNVTNGYEAVKGMFAVLKEVGYTPEWMESVPDGKPVTWAKFMKQGTYTSNEKKAWDFTDAYLTVKENKVNVETQ